MKIEKHQATVAATLMSQGYKSLQPSPCPMQKHFWQEACRLDADLRGPEIVKLAQLVMVMVPSSKEDEQKLSVMNYLKYL